MGEASHDRRDCRRGVGVAYPRLGTFRCRPSQAPPTWSGGARAGTNHYSSVIYVGVTNDLERRVDEHKNGTVRGFTSKYRVNRLVYYESTPDVRGAIAREKQIKGWLRSKKIALIAAANPLWKDLSEASYAEEERGDTKSSVGAEG